MNAGDRPTMAEEAEALVRNGYPDPRGDNDYVPTTEDLRRALRGEGPPPGWEPSRIQHEKTYRAFGGTDRAGLAQMRRRDRAVERRRRAGKLDWEPPSRLARLWTWLLGLDR